LSQDVFCADGMCICPPGYVEETAVVYVCVCVRACMRTVICKHCVSSPLTCRCAQYIWINIAYSPTHLTSQRAAFGPLIAYRTRPILELDLPPTSCERERLVQLDRLAHRQAVHSLQITSYSGMLGYRVSLILQSNNSVLKIQNLVNLEIWNWNQNSFFWGSITCIKMWTSQV